MLGHLQNLVCQEFKHIGRRLTIDLDLLMDMVTLQKYTLPFTSMIPICHLLQHTIRTNRYLSTREIVGFCVQLGFQDILVLEALQDDSYMKLIFLIPQQELYWDNRFFGIL